ncbi:COX15/CtaA family protein [Iodobacter sp. CM08]|uniref:COX15/CtaA family protein n=1 Tax=Iodobacter sp. CM08 TaxID=3085902 RepID=UPI002981C78D|nr:COX15/CtaA family protein [Iodobacter sp. CM08]MDW5417366.1 COX15/CtaA family protein [Iodobacter sp. CM08]
MKPLLYLTLIWTFCLVMLGAYVRLSDAGLGCPDWPGCYGQLSAPDEAHEIAKVSADFGRDMSSEVEPAKGWKEMIHRYFAGGLGLLVLVACCLLWQKRQRLSRISILLPLAVIVFQALLGMWTVTMKLMPVVVTAHLLGGMTLLALLTWLTSRATLAPQLPSQLRPILIISLIAIVLQIALGGWVSTNYAALACNGFPACQGSFTAPAGLSEAMQPLRQLGHTTNGEALTIHHLAAIHWLHRLGALLLLICISALIWQLRKASPRWAGLIAAALLLQISLGISNVWFDLPLPLAVAHNGGAAILLMLVVAVLAQVLPVQNIAKATSPLSLTPREGKVAASTTMPST